MHKPLKKLLFISHDSSLTGGPILLWRLAKVLKQRYNTRIDFVIRRGGVFDKEFRSLGNTIVMQRFRYSLTGKIADRIGFFFKKILTRTRSSSYDMILSNTITNGNIYKLIRGKAPVITYVHELSFSANTASPLDMLEYVVRKTDLFLSATPVIDEHIMNTYPLGERPVMRLPYIVPDHYNEKSVLRQKGLDAFGFPEDTFVIGGMGTLNWRKGIDIYLLIAQKAIRSDPSLRFVWCGGYPDDQHWLAAKHDIKKLGLTEHVKQLPATPEYMKYMAALDLFVLTSREDPYPLVVLEAAMMEIPLICFDHAGGAPDFVRNAGGITVPYLDIDAAANAIVTMKNDPLRREKAAKGGRAKILNEHSEAIVIEHYDKIMEWLCKDRPSKPAL